MTFKKRKLQNIHNAMACISTWDSKMIFLAVLLNFSGIFVFFSLKLISTDLSITLEYTYSNFKIRSKLDELS